MYCDNTFEIVSSKKTPTQIGFDPLTGLVWAQHADLGVNLHLMLDFEAVANPDVEVRPRRRVHNVVLYFQF
jgi:hypothetical protein